MPTMCNCKRNDPRAISTSGRLIERRKSVRDARGIALWTTPSGECVASRVIAARAELLETVLSNTSEADRKTAFSTSLYKCADARSSPSQGEVVILRQLEQSLECVTVR